MRSQIFFAYIIITKAKAEYILNKQGNFKKRRIVISCVRSYLIKFVNPFVNIFRLQRIFLSQQGLRFINLMFKKYRLQ